MDIKELVDTRTRRHPWETARLKAVQRILGPYVFEKIRVLDVGCGDGFITRGLFNHLAEKEIFGVDIHLTDELIQDIPTSGGVRYCKQLPDNGDYDLVLLLDVLEHVENDREFLTSLVSKYVATGGRVMITVPAFNSLYSCHDHTLGHFRRYSLHDLVAVTTASRLKVVSSGYLFISLILPKYILYKVFKPAKGAEGVGRWRRSVVVTKLIEVIFNLDNNVLMAISRIGVKLPGLTGWVLCEKSE